MKVIAPRLITEAALLASSVDEDVAAYPAWDAGTGYAVDAKVSRAVSHRHYVSAAGGNAGHPPEGSPTAWTDVGPTNRWAMFDRSVGTSTTGTGSIVVRVKPGAVNALAVIDTDAETIRVELFVGGASIFDQQQTTNVSGGVIDDWADYFFDDVGKLMAVVFTNLPRDDTAEIRVTITGADPGGPVSVGTMIVGNMLELGSTETGASIGIIDFSRKETDEYGVTDVVERAWAKRGTLRSMIDTSAVDGIQRRLAALRATPALWIGEDGFDSLTIYGFFKDFSIDLALSNISYCSLTIEGLI